MITLENIQEFITDAANKSAFDSIVKAIGYESPDDVAGLKTKIKEKITENTNLKKSFDDYKNSLDNITDVEYAELKARTSGKGAPDEATQQELRDLKRWKEQNKEIPEKFTKLLETHKSTLKEREVVEALTAAGFSSSKINLLKDAFLGKTSVNLKDDGSAEILIATEDGLGASPKEYFKKLAATDEYKDLIDTGSSGAGARRFSGTGAGKPVLTQREYENLSPGEQSNFCSLEGQIRG